MFPTNYLRLFKVHPARGTPYMVDSYGDTWELRQWHVRDADSLMRFGHLCSPDNKAIPGEWLPVSSPYPD